MSKESYQPPSLADKLIFAGIAIGLPTAIYMIMEWLWP